MSTATADRPEQAATVLFLHTASDRAAIMRRVWTRGRNAVARSAKLGIVPGNGTPSLRAAFADTLRLTWDEARSLAAWRAEQDAAAEAAKALNARTREIAALASLASLRTGWIAAPHTAPRFMPSTRALQP